MVSSRPISVMLAVCLTIPVLCRAQEKVTVTVDRQERHQTILGWGKTTPWMTTSELARDQCIERAVNDFGINRLRFEGMCGNGIGHRSWEWRNDNDDPHVINWDAFNVDLLDRKANTWLVPWKRAVEKRGEPFNIYVSPSFFRGGSSGDVPPWMLGDPQEYAEWAEALLLRLREVHGITADYYCICNEAGNNNAFSPQVVEDAIKALMPRLRAQGFPTTIAFTESINTSVAVRYVEHALRDPEAWKWVGLISYHLYGTKPDTLARLRQMADEHGLPTAQTEFMNLTIDHLYSDMTIGGVSYWEVYGLLTTDFQAALSHASSTSFRGGRWYWRFRQVSRYVRPGAVRIGATSDDAGLRALAYDKDGRTILVLINTGKPARERIVHAGGLVPGFYGMSRSVGQRACEELGTTTIAEAGSLDIRVPGDCVLTVYPREEGNLPPVVLEWRSRPDFLTLPASGMDLECAATDPDGDDLSFNWSVLGAPGGAQVTLDAADAARARAEGMTVPGRYTFEVAASDSKEVVRRRIMTTVYDGNQPPVPIDVHNRIPVQPRVADAQTLLRAGAFDIEGDPVTFKWSVVRSPTGTAPVLESPDEAACKVTGLTKAGEYTFRLTASDPTHSVEVDHVVEVFP